MDLGAAADVGFAAAAGRTWWCFVVLGVDIDFQHAAVLAAASLLVKLSGLTPNGLGLAEWVVAGLATMLTPIESATVAAAVLLDRAVEVGVMLLAGLFGLGALARAERQAARAR